MTPAAISEIEKAYIERIKDKREYDEQIAWLNRQYVRAAIISAFVKKVKYPKNPIEERELKRTDFTDDEKEQSIILGLMVQISVNSDSRMIVLPIFEILWYTRIYTKAGEPIRYGG